MLVHLRGLRCIQAATVMQRSDITSALDSLWVQKLSKEIKQKLELSRTSARKGKPQGPANRSAAQK